MAQSLDVMMINKTFLTQQPNFPWLLLLMDDVPPAESKKTNNDTQFCKVSL